MVSMALACAGAKLHTIKSVTDLRNAEAVKGISSILFESLNVTELPSAFTKYLPRLAVQPPEASPAGRCAVWIAIHRLVFDYTFKFYFCSKPSH